MLAGKPIRLSPATDIDQNNSHDGFIKVRLGHSDRGTVIIPEMIFAKVGPWRYFQPSFFGPCFIGFEIEDDLHIATFSVDVGPPRTAAPTRLIVKIRSDERILAFSDGSQLYACQIIGPQRLAPIATGRCQRMENGGFAIRLFHQTNRTAFASIRSTQELWASTWNLQGTRRLKNVTYVYLTSLPKIICQEDLNRIAMASNGILRFQTTSSRAVEEVLELQVYRENTRERTSRLEVYISTALLAPPHLLFHPMISSEPAYYEIVGPEIFRVGLTPGAKLPIPRGTATPTDDSLKSFEYIVMGDAGSTAGLAAPYDEEETLQVMHLEQLEDGNDLFEFWRKHANKNQMNRPDLERRTLEPPDT